MHDLRPATHQLARLVEGVRDDQLDDPTPCPQMTVAALLHHVDGLSQAFTAAAVKSPLDETPSADASALPPDWRTRLSRRLEDLAAAWRDPSAWTGMTAAGRVALPGEVAGAVAINEVVVHAWDLAVATGQHFSCDDALLAAALEFVGPAAEQNPEGTPGLFGPPVPVGDDASPVDRLVALTGRDPAWRVPVG